MSHPAAPTPGNPLVSVVVPAYQRAGSIRRALDSVLRQTMQDFEVVVVDDGSTDGTVDIVRGIEDERVRLLVHETNRGGNAARQTGIDDSRGTWVAFLDSDDVWVENKLEAQLHRLNELGPDYGFCYTWYDIELTDGTFLPPREVHVEGFRRPELATHHAVGTFSTMLVSRAVLNQVGGVDLALPACQDWDFVLRVNAVTGVAVVPEVLVHYWHGQGDPHRITTRKTSVIEGHRKVYDRLREQYPSMEPEDVVASQQYVMAALAQQGAVLEVLRVVRDLDRRALNAENARFVGHMVARAGRKRLQSRG